MGNKKTKNREKFILTEEDKKILIETTNFTKEQIEEWYNGFLKDFPDGRLDKKKFTQIYKKSYSSGNPNAFADHIFRAFDMDSNGTIDFSEFLLAVSITSNSTDIRQKLKWMFRIYDIDGNGKIDKKELQTIIDSIYKLLNNDKKKHAEHMDEIFRKFEIDKKKFITLEEFTDRCMQDQLLLKLLAPSP